VSSASHSYVHLTSIALAVHCVIDLFAGMSAVVVFARFDLVFFQGFTLVLFAFNVREEVAYA
jgi:hypothetical protein